MKANKFPGLYVVYDGIIGCGKSAQIKLLKELTSRDFPDVRTVFTYEPGGNDRADVIRQKVKYEQMTPQKEVELYAASRAITLPEIVRPALKEGCLVISDRCFTTSLDYQGIGRGVGLDNVWKVNEPVVGGTFPDVIVFPKVGIEASLKRSGGDNPDKFDKEAHSFWEKTLEGYSKVFNFVQKLSPTTKLIQINDPEGKLNIEQMGDKINSELYPLINNWRKEGKIQRERE